MEDSGHGSKEARIRRGLERAHAAQDRRNHEEALRLYSALADEFPDTVEIYRDRAHHFWVMRQYEHAISDSSRVLELEPDDLLTLFWRGALWVHVDKPEKAVEDLSKVIDSDWHYTLDSAHFCRAVAYLQQQRFEDALADIRHAPDDAILGRVLRYEWKTTAAIAEAAEAGIRRQGSPKRKASRRPRKD